MRKSDKETVKRFLFEISNTVGKMLGTGKIRQEDLDLVFKDAWLARIAFKGDFKPWMTKGGRVMEEHIVAQYHTAKVAFEWMDIVQQVDGIVDDVMDGVGPFPNRAGLSELQHIRGCASAQFGLFFAKFMKKERENNG